MTGDRNVPRDILVPLGNLRMSGLEWRVVVVGRLDLTRRRASGLVEVGGVGDRLLELRHGPALEAVCHLFPPVNVAGSRSNFGLALQCPSPLNRCTFVRGPFDATSSDPVDHPLAWNITAR